jgi:4-hydroxy-tetrahydrodipicolinate reductase
MTLKILLIGATGRVGQEVQKAIMAAPDSYQLALAATGRMAIEDTSLVVDVAIDFSSSQALVNTMPYLQARGIPLVCGTTGLSAEAEEALRAHAATTATLYAPNMSIGINILAQIVQQIAAKTEDIMDAGILDIHHRHKKDSPSGTALMMQRVIQEASQNPDKIVECTSLRLGEGAGENHVHFHGAGESLTLTHRAFNRSIYATGALKVASWLAQQPPHPQKRLYAMKDFLVA